MAVILWMDKYKNKTKKILLPLFISSVLILFNLPSLSAEPTPRCHADQLCSFVHAAIQNNPAICAAKANVAAAEARYIASSQPIYNPELTADAQKAIENTYSVGINQTIDIANKRCAKSKIGEANLQAAKAQLAKLEQQLTADLLNALIAYRTQERVVFFANERTNILKRFVVLSKKLLASGDITRVDVDLAQLAYSDSIAQQAQAGVRLTEALQTLRAITGCSHTNLPNFPQNLPCLLISDHKIDCLLQSLPEFHVLNNQYLSARARINLAQRERYPDPTIGIQVGQQEESGEKKTLVGATLTVPLFIRNPYRAEVAAASGDAAEADQKRLDWIRTTRAELLTSAERYQILSRALNQWENISNQPLKDGINLIERLWQAGELSTTEYLVQLRQRVDNQITGALLKAQTWQTWVSWLKSSGQSESWLCHYSP
jgi:cobalt-zinc-cadmium efflux system outer membrane protein